MWGGGVINGVFSTRYSVVRVPLLRGPLGLKGWALGRLRLKRLKTGARAQFKAAWAAADSLMLKRSYT